MTTINRVILTPQGEFSLAASIRFLGGFAPLSYEDEDGGPAQTLRLAFPVERDWRTVAVSAHETDGGRVGAAICGDGDPDLGREQLERMLSLDVDASSLRRTLRDDEVASRLVAQFPGLRPVCFASPYEAAAWAVMSQRVQMRQAAKVRVRMCERLGRELSVDGETLHAFPDPETLRATRSIDGLSDVKVQRLQGIAEAALDGRLDAATLRAAGPEQAIEDVQQIPGIGPFGADLVVIRGAGEPDHFSRTERRLHREMADAYGVDAADVDALAAIADGWRPFRSWIGFLFRARLATGSS
jgi:3-methyladenine DNA glycosylase/8-oxoguanine DNA glycosylase